MCEDALEVACYPTRGRSFPPGIVIEWAMDRRGDAVRGDPGIAIEWAMDRRGVAEGSLACARAGPARPPQTPPRDAIA
jgi:hypothetical protein